MTRKVKCPRCNNETEYSPENEFRPFCSERCKLIDFGDWANGKFAIPAEEEQSATNELEDEIEIDSSDDTENEH